MSADALNSPGCSLLKKGRGFDTHSSYPWDDASVSVVFDRFWLRQFYAFVPMNKVFKAALVL